MKKFFLLCLAVAIAATSLPAFAASSVEFTGYVKVFHESLGNLQRLNKRAVGDTDSDSFFENKLQINFRIKPTDDITVHWTMRTVSYARWGLLGAGTGGGPGTTGVFTRWLYAQVDQPWGTLYIGRLGDSVVGNVGGLASLGYSNGWGSEFTYVMPFDIDGPSDGLAFTTDFGNGFGFAFYYAKDAADPYLGTSSAAVGNNSIQAQHKDADRDRFGIEGTYQWDGGGIALGLAYISDKRPTVTTLPLGYADRDIHYFLVNPAFVQNWGPFSVHFEGAIAFGKAKITDYNLTTSLWSPTDDDKVGGLGLYLDFVYNYGAGDVALAAWYVSGEDQDDNDKFNEIVTMGDFAPFLVAYYGWTLGNSAFSSTLVTGQNNNPGVYNGNQLSNHWALAILGNHSITDDISINYGIGYFRLAQETRTPDPITGRRQSKNLGWEIDLGARFQLLDNLSFETKFGYMFNGDAYKGVADPDNYDLKDTFAWVNVLEVTF